MKQARLLITSERSNEELWEIKLMFERIKEEQQRFKIKFPPITKKTKTNILVNQLNYLNMMKESVALQLCLEDDFIYENSGMQFRNRMQIENRTIEFALQSKISSLIDESKETLEKI